MHLMFTLIKIREYIERHPKTRHYSHSNGNQKPIHFPTD